MLIKYWREILLVLLLGISSTIGYYAIYNRGVNSVEEMYAKKIEDHNARVLDQVLKVQDLSSQLAQANRKQAALVSRDLQQILIKLNQKPLFQINPQGICVPSQDFLEGYNTIIDRANK